MDANRFDAFTRLIGSRTSRRIAIGLGATGLLFTAVPEAEARKCSKKNPCPKCYRCRKHRCRPLCGAGKICQDGVCCDPGFADCDGDGNCEVDLRTNTTHCGRCATACGTGATCLNGACTSEGGCPEGCDGSGYSRVGGAPGGICDE